ncbi:hypothetical protein BJ912DRAFT_1058154 [Pholiota molesta]|nr:hypothetical protein BJ912DRAFT_1058154 [Pholiota molesta]
MTGSHIHAPTTGDKITTGDKTTTGDHPEMSTGAHNIFAGPPIRCTSLVPQNIRGVPRPPAVHPWSPHHRGPPKAHHISPAPRRYISTGAHHIPGSPARPPYIWSPPALGPTIYPRGPAARSALVPTMYSVPPPLAQHRGPQYIPSAPPLDQNRGSPYIPGSPAHPPVVLGSPVLGPEKDRDWTGPEPEKTGILMDRKRPRPRSGPWSNRI